MATVLAAVLLSGCIPFFPALGGSVGIHPLPVGGQTARESSISPGSDTAVRTPAQATPISMLPGGFSRPGTNVSPAIVLDTVVPLNGTLVPGNFVPENATYPSDIAYDSRNGYVFVATYGGAIPVINTTTDQLVDLIATGSSLGGIAYDGSNNEVYASQYGNGSVRVIDPATDNITRTITVGAQPGGEAFDHWNGDVYVTNYDSNNVSVIDGATNKVVRWIGVGDGPAHVTVGGANGYVFVSNTGSSNVTVIDGGTNAVVGSATTGIDPGAMAYDPSNGYLYVANAVTDDVTVLDTDGLWVTTITSAGVCPWGVAYDGLNEMVYVTDTTCTMPGGYVTEIDASTNGIVARVGVGNYPYAILFDQSNGELFTTNTYSDNITVLNGSSREVVCNLGVGTYPTAAAFDGSNGDIYVANYGTNNVTVLDGRTDFVIGSINVGWGPDGIAYDPSNGYLYVANYASDNVSVIDSQTTQVVGSIPVGAGPEGVAYANSTGNIYVADWNSDNVSVINTTTNQAVGSIPVGTAPTQMAYDSANGQLFVVNSGGIYVYEGLYQNVSVIDVSTNKDVGSITVGEEPTGVTYDSANQRIYVANDFYEPNLSVIDANNDTVIGSIHVGGSPWGVGYDNKDGELFVTTGDEVAVINATLGTVLGKVPVGTWPVAVVIDERTGEAIITNRLSGTISVLRPTIYPVPKYNVTFEETGLPVGTPWLVTFNSTWLSSTTGAIRFFVADGAYSYIVSNVSGYAASPLSGLVTVHDGDVNVTINFSPFLYAVTFQETGLPNGTAWSIIWNGSTKTSTGSFLTVEAPNGTYGFEVPPADGMNATPANVSVNVDGYGPTILVTFSRYLAPGPTILSFVTNRSNLTVNSSFALTVVVTGGELPLSYIFTGLPSNCPSINASTVSCTPAQKGVYSIAVIVTDALNRSNRSSVSVKVTEAPGKSRGTSGGPTLWGLPQEETFGLIAGLAVTIVTVVVLGLRRLCKASSRTPGKGSPGKPAGERPTVRKPRR